MAGPIRVYRVIARSFILIDAKIKSRMFLHSGEVNHEYGFCLMTFRRVFSKAYHGYKYSMKSAFSPKYLLYTNIFLSTGISTTGDLLEQTYEVYQNSLGEIDYYRTAHMAFSGAIAGVISHHWYIFLDKIITGRSWPMLMNKLMLDQCIFSPLVILSFFATVAIFEEHPYENFTEEVKDKFWTLYKAEWVVWPPAQIINFYFLPTRYRVAYDNTISLGYDIFTSHIKHDKTSQEERKSSKNSPE